MKVIYRVLLIVVAVCVPVVSLLSALNIVFRLPDLYIYQFNNNQIASQVDLGITDEELGRFFSDFMKGEKDEFDLFTEYRDREQAVFGTSEKINMDNARKLLNHSLYILGGAALLLIISYGVILARKKKYELRGAYKAGILVFIILVLLFYSLLYFDQTKSGLFDLIFINSFGVDDVLPLMLTGQFEVIALTVISTAGLVLLVILASVTWRLTKPRRMFW